MNGESAIIVAAARTPIGTAGRSLSHVSVEDLGASVLRSLVGRPGLKAEDVDDVVLGNCMGPGGNLARVAALAAGLPAHVPAVTIDRQCASGLAAVVVAEHLIRGGAHTVLAGGAESASTAPWRYWPATDGGEAVRYTRAPFAPAGHEDPDMGLANDLLAAAAGVSRLQQDRYAARSHARAALAQESGVFDAEIVSVGGVHRDDRPRHGLTAERLARLRPAFRPEGTVTAGNSCGISDGAAAVTLLSEHLHRRLDLPGLRILSTATCGVAPSRPGLGLVPAVRFALSRADLRLDDIDAVELNEAFAGQVLACCRELQLDPLRVCPDGGALAIGHPWGASGAVLLVRLFSTLVTRGRGRYGLAAIAPGGGPGGALGGGKVPTC
jgi:acetyl-CoA C-acetyltransferase